MTTTNGPEPDQPREPRRYPVTTAARLLHPDGEGGITASSVTKEGWGPWTLNLWSGRLEIAGGEVYYINLTRTRDSADLLDYVFQVVGKDWATDDVLAGMLRAFDDILHPQANLCPGGVPHGITVEQLAALITGAGHPAFSRIAVCAGCDMPEGTDHKPDCPVITGRAAEIHQPEGKYLP